MMVMCLSVLPSFASAADFDVLKGKVGYLKNNSEKFKNMTDGNKNTYDMFFQAEKSPVFFDLEKEYDITGFKMSVGSKGGMDRLAVQYLDSDFNVLKTYRAVTDATEVVKKVRYVTFSYVYINELLIYDFNLFADDGRIDEVKNVNAVTDVNKVTLNWDNPPQEKFSGVNIYKDNTFVAKVDKPINSYVVNNLKDDTNYIFSLRAFDDKGLENPGVTKAIKTLIDPKKIPPNPVTSLVAEAQDKSVKLNWKSPKDKDLAGFKLFKNGKLFAQIGLEEEFVFKNLEPVTDYSFGVVAVDADKNDSVPVNLSIKTLEENDEEPPHVPSNVFAKPSNGALIGTWDKVTDKDLAGYNVYLDGKKINSNLITSTTFVIKNLENNKKYKVQVQAVDRSGNGSELSLAAFGTPDVHTIPVIESNYGVKDVSDGIGVMFVQIWPLLAFAVGIPLGFYVIYKLKRTILP